MPALDDSLHQAASPRLTKRERNLDSIWCNGREIDLDHVAACREWAIQCPGKFQSGPAWSNIGSAEAAIVRHHAKLTIAAQVQLEFAIRTLQRHEILEPAPEVDRRATRNITAQTAQIA